MATNMFDVTAFGAVGDYNPQTGTGSDSTAAFRAAWAAALAHSRHYAEPNRWLTTVGIYVPAGDYLVDLTTDVLGDATQATRGTDIFGDGAQQSVVYLKGSAFFIKNANTLGFFKIRSIAFVGLTGEERLMSLSSDWPIGKGQSVDRYEVHTVGLAQLYDITGRTTADCCSHILCRDTQSRVTTLPFISINNSQSIQHNFVACHAEVSGPYFDIQAGGNINWYGGAIHMYPTAEAFLKIHGTDMMLGGVNTFTGIHFECDHPAGILRLSAEARVAFRDCDFMVIDEARPELIGFDVSRGMLTIDHCSLNLKIAVTSNENTYAPAEAPFVQVSNCMLYRPPEELVVIRPALVNSGGKGKVKFTNCRGMSPHPPDDLWLGDCYINYDTGFDRHARTPNVGCFQVSPENGHGLPDATPHSFTVAGARAFVYMLKIINRGATNQVFAVKAPSGTLLATSKPGHKYSTTMCDLEITPSEKLSVVNLTDKRFADGYVLVFYI